MPYRIIQNLKNILMKTLLILIILVEINEGRWYNWNGSEKSKQIYIVKKEKR